MKNIITTDTTTTPKAAMTDLDAALLAGQCAPSTISMYQRDAAAYIAWCKSAGVAPVDSISLARWRARHLHVGRPGVAALSPMAGEDSIRTISDRVSAPRELPLCLLFVRCCLF